MKGSVGVRTNGFERAPLAWISHGLARCTKVGGVEQDNLQLDERAGGRYSQ
jgi:hypothetical protein